MSAVEAELLKAWEPTGAGVTWGTELCVLGLSRKLFIIRMLRTAAGRRGTAEAKEGVDKESQLTYY